GKRKWERLEGKSARRLRISARGSPADSEAGDSSFLWVCMEYRMRVRMFLLAVIVGLSVGFIACSGNEANNANANANTNANVGGPRSQATPMTTPTPKYTEEQARAEREKAKANKETIGQSFEDAWIHAKIVAKLI